MLYSGLQKSKGRTGSTAEMLGSTL